MGQAWDEALVMRDLSAARRPRMPVRSLVIATAIALGLLVSSCGVLNNDKPTIRLYDGQWDTLWVNNAIVAFIIEHGYGYPVEQVVSTTKLYQEQLPAGDLDVVLEGWQQNVASWYQQQMTVGRIVNLGPIYEESRQGFAIPTWVAEEHGIVTVSDMAEQWRVFQDPADPSKGVFVSCAVGTGCLQINRVKLEAYGLARYFNTLEPSSNAAAEDALISAQRQERPVFGFLWSPSATASFDWHVLEEPEHSEQCWDAVTAAANGTGDVPAEACEYQSLPIDSLAHAGLDSKAPDVFAMLVKMNVGSEPLNETLAWATEQGIEDWNLAAIHYLETHDDRWRSWVTPEAARRIDDALAERAN